MEWSRKGNMKTALRQEQVSRKNKNRILWSRSFPSQLTTTLPTLNAVCRQKVELSMLR